MKRLIPLMILAMLLLIVPARSQAAELITGRVLDAGGRPLAGSQVELYHWKLGLVGMTTVAPDGSYQFQQTYGPGLYQVRAWAKGYRLAETGWTFGSGLSAQQLRLSPLFGEVRLRVTDTEGAPLRGDAWLTRPGGALVRTFPVTDGLAVVGEVLPGSYQLLLHVSGYGVAAQAVQVMAGERSPVAVAMAPQGARLSGQALDQVTGLPIRGDVELLGADGTRLQAAHLDDGGRFRLEAAASTGEVRLRVWAPGYQAVLTPPFTAQGARDWSAGDALRLPPLFGSVEGVLANRFGRGLPRTAVYLVRDGVGEVAAAQTDANGRFQFTQVPAGTGYRLVADQIADASAVESIFPPISAPFTVQGGQQSRITLATRAQPTQPISTGQIAGVVRGPDGQPVADATVNLYRYSKVERTVKSGPDGSFQIDNVPGTAQDGWSNPPLSLRVTKAGYLPARAVTLAGQTVYEFSLPGFGVLDFDVRLQPEQVVARGRVADLKGAPVAGATVTLQGVAKRYSVQTDRFGLYQLTVPWGDVALGALSVEAAGYRAKSGIAVGAGVLATGDLPSLLLEPVQETKLGQLLSANGEGLVGEQLTLWTGAAQPVGTVLTDAAGGFRLAVPAGQQSLLLTGAGTAALVNGGAGGSAVLTLVNAPADGEIVGWLKALDGRPVGGVPVTLLEEGVGPIAEVESAADGSFRFPNLTVRGSGWYIIRAPGVPYGAPFLLRPGEQFLQTLWLRK